ncbi:hypothetical protein KIK84_03455 [Curvibacter sp. CHRR-16]|uniref:hypothetical protein n=1 Tax=Curvibacter sp. CHRR-16 TaxID=2835872 RepID=UPI001BDAE9D8|nr:hypothetical protein [Curvibacter sp. CHRR-16]MBT0569368.1 hypothetical protein [Curvibacter sp. CHRR-16]
MDDEKSEIAAVAARWVVEEGLDFAAAKQRAVKALGLGARAPLPDNLQLEEAVQEYISIFCADTQPQELRVLRELALQWMQRMAVFHPHISGAVWHGWATQHSDVFIQLFCDDPKSAEIALIDAGVSYEPHTMRGLHGDPVEALSVHVPIPQWHTTVGVHLQIYDADDLRGALQADGLGRKPRGDAAALSRLLEAHHG